MKNVISFIFGALLVLVLLLFLHSNLDNYKNIAKAYETNRDNFESVANELMNYTEDIYIDKDNVSDVGKVLNDKYGINLSLEKINIIFKNKFKSITKRGNSIFTGWTNKEGKTIDENSLITSDDNEILYATWSKLNALYVKYDNTKSNSTCETVKCALDELSKKF